MGPVRFSASSPSAGLTDAAREMGLSTHGSMAASMAVESAPPLIQGWNAEDGGAELDASLEPALSFLARDFDNLVKSGKTTVEVEAVEGVMTNKHKIDIATTRAALAGLTEHGVLAVIALGQGADKIPAYEVVAAPHL